MSDPSNPYFTKVIDTNHDSKDVLALYNAGVIPLTYRVIHNTINVTTAGVYPLYDLKGDLLQFQSGTHVIFAGSQEVAFSNTNSTVAIGLSSGSLCTPTTNLVTFGTGLVVTTQGSAYVSVASNASFVSMVMGATAQSTGAVDITLIVV